jgi:hypothetical protein
MLTVACVLSEGPKRTYDTNHVERLKSQIKLAQPYEFVCLDDSPFPGWWAKISLFEPGRFEGRILYLDLDVTVVDLLDDIADYPASFAAIKDWLRPTINSSVMAWDAGMMDRIYTNFTPSVMERLAGDQDWITEQMPDTEVFPEEWCVSYRKHVRMFKVVPPNAKVVVYHGFPKPWEIK